jgi:two-component system chemotaxis sensor kinase CheA
MSYSSDELVEAYLEECQEHLTTIEESLLALDGGDQSEAIINALFRAVHSIKGGAGFFGFDSVGQLSHVMENLMNKARNKEIVLEQKHIDVLFKGLDKLKVLLTDINAEIDIGVEVDQIEELLGESGLDQKVTLKGKSFDQNDSLFKNFTIRENDIKQAVDQQMHIYAAQVYLKKDILNKDKTPTQYIAEIESIGQFLDSYLDIENAAPLDQALGEDLPFIFLFTTVLDESFITDALHIPAEQIVHIDTDNLEDDVMTKDKDGNAVPLTSLIQQKKSQETTAEPTEDKPLTDEPKTMEAKESSTQNVEATKTETHSIQAAETLRVKVSQLNKLVNLAGELVLARNQLMRVTESHAQNIPGLPTILQNVNIIASELQEEIMNARMQPISIIFNKFSRVIHDLARNLKKKISLRIEGGDVELDKTIIELLSDPLNHIIRNAADHGLESPEKRLNANKTEDGHITLKAYHLGGLINIDVIDDGAGIDPEKICKIAIDKGVITRDEADKMSDKDKIKLIYAPGFSTAAEVSDVSGRGVGMDVVVTNIKKLGGTIDISSKVGKGTTIHMTLPLTLAIVSSLIVETKKERFAIPQANIEEIVRVQAEELYERIAQVHGGDVLKLRGNLLPLVHLAEGIGMNTTVNADGSTDTKPTKPQSVRDAGKSLKILVVTLGTNSLGIVVDEVLGNEEIVVKPMPEYVRSLYWYAGSTILGDGKVALILDVPGFSNKNKVRFSEIAAAAAQQQADEDRFSSDTTMESVDLLIFNNGTPEQFAVPISLIQRVDEVDAKKIELIGDKEYLDYQNKSMLLTRIENLLPVQRPQRASEETVKLIIPKRSRKPVGIIIDQVVDTKNLAFSLEKDTIEADGLIGSVIIDGRITLLLDLDTLTEKILVGQKGQLFGGRGEGKHILLVEDTPFYTNIEKQYLMSDGYKVTTAADGEEALEILETNSFDAIITDIEMPRMNGYELVANLRDNAEYNKVPIVALTAIRDENARSKSQQLGFNGWLDKLDKDILLTELAQILGDTRH